MYNALVVSRNQKLYLPSVLRKQRLVIDKCDTILQVVVLSHMPYTLPTFYMYITKDMVDKVNVISQKARK